MTFNWLRRLRAFSCFAILFAVTTVANAQMQTAGNCPPACGRPWLANNRRVQLTYSGNVYYHFPNYTVATNTLPFFPGERGRPSSREALGGRVIYFNDEGMSWDGNQFFVHPSYPYELATGHFYSQQDALQQQPATNWRQPSGIADNLAPAYPPTPSYESYFPPKLTLPAPAAVQPKTTWRAEKTFNPYYFDPLAPPTNAGR
ncbi:MAG: hypothetical protein R3C28_26220 [Pirellulaceae bacterium]